ncbi:MAG: aminoglycoside phosphotransferase family protein [Candidatus Uhrbacteria bacterium]
MKPILNHSKILKTAADLLKENFIDFEFVVDGVDSVVCKVKTESGASLVIKVGPNADADAFVLRKLEGRNIKVPHLLGETKLQQGGRVYPLIVMTCFSGELFKDIAVAERPGYIKEILEEFNKVHSVKSPGRAGYILDVIGGKESSWKDYLLRNLTGENLEFDWKKVFSFKNVNPELVERALKQAKEKVLVLSDDIELRLIHTDINGANIFVKDGHLEGIIDWSDAKFGDPLFDLGRFRMNIRNRMDENTLQAYYEAVNLSDVEINREKIYYLINVLEYINWYVEYGWEDMVLLQMELLKEIV